MPGLEQLLDRLISSRVEFVVVGGFAAMTHGVTLLTQDIDICCRFSVENLMRLRNSISDLHPVHRMTPQRVPLELTEQNCGRFSNLYLLTDFGVLDCLSEVLGVGDFDVVMQRSTGIELRSGLCRVLDIDALIEAKEAMNRPHDKQTAVQLKAIRDRGGAAGPR